MKNNYFSNCILFVSLTLFTYGFNVERVSAGGTPSLNFLMTVASELNNSMPMVVDNEFIVKSVYAQIGAIGYIYILRNYDANQIDGNAFLAQQAKPVKNMACTNPGMQTFFNDNVKVIYSYHGKEGKHIGDITITRRDCDNL